MRYKYVFVIILLFVCCYRLRPDESNGVSSVARFDYRISRSYLLPIDNGILYWKYSYLCLTFSVDCEFIHVYLQILLDFLLSFSFDVISVVLQ